MSAEIVQEKPSFSKRIALAPVNFWLATRAFRRPTCRYYPSCADYAAEAIQTHGPIRGWWMSLKRLARCNPWGGYGIDPVPSVDKPGESVGNVKKVAA